MDLGGPFQPNIPLQMGKHLETSLLTMTDRDQRTSAPTLAADTVFVGY